MGNKRKANGTTKGRKRQAAAHLAKFRQSEKEREREQKWRFLLAESNWTMHKTIKENDGIVGKANESKAMVCPLF